MPSIYELLRTFDDQNKFDGHNYAHWVTEFDMTFAPNKEIMAHVYGASTMPKESADQAAWYDVDREARAALYKTISSNTIRSAHFKQTKPAQTAHAVWLSLRAEYQKDSRAARFELKKRLYNPTHDITKPVSTYIQDIISAGEALAALGHKPADTDVVDSILMNLDPSFTSMRIFLTTQNSEPTLDAVKKTLTDQEDTNAVLNGGTDVKDAKNAEGAMYGRKGGRTKKKGSRKRDHSDSGSDSDSDPDTPSYDWLNTKGKDVCHRCGRPGHRSSRCIADMPQRVKDKIIKAARKRRASSSPEDRAAFAHQDGSHTASDSESDTDSVKEHAHVVGTRRYQRDLRREAQALVERIHG